MKILSASQPPSPHFPLPPFRPPAHCLVHSRRRKFIKMKLRLQLTGFIKIYLPLTDAICWRVSVFRCRRQRAPWIIWSVLSVIFYGLAYTSVTLNTNTCWLVRCSAAPFWVQLEVHSDPPWKQAYWVKHMLPLIQLLLFFLLLLVTKLYHVKHEGWTLN